MKSALKHYGEMLESIRESGTYKNERIITTPQKARIDTTEAKNVLNMCANNYLGLSDSKELIEAAKASYDKWGFGLSSVRFICGTQGLHKELEHKIANFVKMDDCILYSSCFDANGGLFETLLGPEDAVISDELNHASIIDGVRLCKAKRYRYKNNNMEDLRAQLQDAKDSGCKIKLIATDGVFSMDGYIANLKGIWWTTATPWASWASTAGAPPSIAELKAGWTSSPVPWARLWAGLPAATPPQGRR